MGPAAGVGNRAASSPLFGRLRLATADQPAGAANALALLLARSDRRVGALASRHRGQFRRRLQDCARGRAILVHLRLQRLSRAKLSVCAQEGNEFDFDVVAVKIAIKIEQEYLQHRLAIVEGRSGAEIGCRKVALPVVVDEHRIDAITQSRSARQGHVRGRVTKAGSSLGSSNDLTGQAPPVAKDPRCRADIAVSEVGTYRA